MTTYRWLGPNHRLIRRILNLFGETNDWQSPARGGYGLFSVSLRPSMDSFEGGTLWEARSERLGVVLGGEEGILEPVVDAASG